MTVFHLSEAANIQLFEPRTIEGSTEALVWAVNDERLHNYLLPRDCPRVTFYAGPRTSAEDRKPFLGSSPAVVAIESAWFERMRACRLFCYHLPGDTFSCHDETAGYFVSRIEVKPTAVECIDDLMLAPCDAASSCACCHASGRCATQSSHRRLSSPSFGGAMRRHGRRPVDA